MKILKYTSELFLKKESAATMKSTLNTACYKFQLYWSWIIWDIIYWKINDEHLAVVPITLNDWVPSHFLFNQQCVDQLVETQTLQSRLAVYDLKDMTKIVLISRFHLWCGRILFYDIFV